MKQETERAGPASLVLAPQRATGEPYTTSEIIAAGTGINHRRVRDAIRKYQTDLEAFGRVIAYQAPRETISVAYAPEIKGQETRGRKAIGYILNEQQATFLLTLLKNTPVVVAFKKELVRQFYAMRSLLLERASPVWQDARSLGIAERDRAQVVQLTALLLVEQTIAREITAGIEAGVPYWAIYRAIRDRLAAFPAVGAPAGKE